MHISKRTAALAAAICLLAGAAGAQPVGHVVSVETMPVFHRNVKPQCIDGEGADRWYGAALTGWESMQTRADDMALCAALAARAGYVPAETLLGRVYIHTRQHYGADIAPPFRDPEAALYWFAKAADGGDGHAAMEAGALYEMGVGMPQDDARATQWYQRAAALGDGDGRDRLKHLASRPARIAAFEARYKAKAEAGDGAALFAIADAYVQGDPYAADDEAAAAWLKRAAEAGYAPAQSRLGRLSVTGDAGVKRDETAGYDWLIKACAGGIHDGDPLLLTAYQESKLSPAQIAMVQQLAAGGKLHNWVGQTVHFNASKTTLDNAAPGADAPDTSAAPAESLDALTRKAQGGDDGAQTLLGLRYLTGDGVAKDAATARGWFEKAADQTATAAMNLGDMAYTGEGGAVDFATAANWYAQAAVLGDSLGAKNAEAIWNTAGTTFDPVKAYAMAMQMQQDAPSAARPILERLRATTPPAVRTDALIWLCRLRLAHAQVFN